MGCSLVDSIWVLGLRLLGGRNGPFMCDRLGLVGSSNGIAEALLVSPSESDCTGESGLGGEGNGPVILLRLVVTKLADE